MAGNKLKMTRTKPHDRGGVQSVEVGLKVLVALADAGGEETLTRIAELSDMAPAKAHRYLASMTRAGFVERSDSNRYMLGPKALSVGLAALSRVDVLDAARDELLKLRDVIKATVLLAVWGTNGPTVVRWIESPRPITVNIRVGSNMPLLLSATGRVFSAFLPEEQTGPLLAQERSMLRRNGKSAIDRKAFEDLMADVRERGLGSTAGDMLAGVFALAAPVFDHDDRLCAVITALGPEALFDIQPDGRTARELQKAARRVSERLGSKRGS